MTAGAVGYSRAAGSSLVAGIAAVVWGGYSTLLGVSAGVFLHDHPLVGVAVGVIGGVFVGCRVDASSAWSTARVARRPAAEDVARRQRRGRRELRGEGPTARRGARRRDPRRGGVTAPGG